MNLSIYTRKIHIQVEIAIRKENQDKDVNFEYFINRGFH